MAAKQTQAWETWRRIADSSAFLASHSDWAGYVPIANFGVVSDFTGDNEFFSHELLNPLARTGGQYRILPKGELTASSFDGLRAVIYADAQPPAPDLRQAILGFVGAGGMLITMPAWGEAPGGTAWPAGQDPRYSLRALGKGRLAVAREAQNDPIDPTITFVAFLMTVLVGAKHFAHAALLRGDQAVHALLGIERFPIDGTIRNLFRAFTMSNVQRFFEPLAEWQMQRLLLRRDGCTLDLDSTVFERYGKQEGPLRLLRPQPTQTRASQSSSSAGGAE